MIFLWVMLGMIALMVLLLALPLYINADYDEEFRLSIQYEWLRFQLIPKEENGRKPKRLYTAKKKKAKPDTKKEGSFSALIKNQGVGGAVSLIWRVVKLAGGAFHKTLRGVAGLRFDLTVSVGGEDAAEAAVSYGRTCAVIYPAVGMVASQMKYMNHNIDIHPDFDSEDTKFTLSARFRVIPMLALGHFLAAAIKLLWGVIMDKVRESSAQALQEAATDA